MKRAMLSLGMVLMSSVAFGQQRIELSAGSTVKMTVGQTTIVSCDAKSSEGSSGGKCTMKRENGWYNVYTSAGNFVESGTSLDTALVIMEKLKKAGACD